jgi:hypothetical protein
VSTLTAPPTTPSRDGATPADRLERIEALLAELLRAQREAAPASGM